MTLCTPLKTLAVAAVLTGALTAAPAIAQITLPGLVKGIDGAPHGMGNWEGHPEWMGYKQKVVSWLGEKLAGAADDPQPDRGARS